MSFAASLTTSTGFNPSAYLAKFGYAEGKGLGKNEDGRTTHIAVQKKDDSKGIGAHEDFTKSFEVLFDKAAATNGAIKPGITFFDSDDEDAAPKSSGVAAVSEEDARKQRKEEKKRKKEAKKAKREVAAANESTDDESAERAAKRARRSPSPDAAVAAPSPVAPAASSGPRTLPPSSTNFIRFNMGSRLLADSHAEVDLKGNTVRQAGVGAATAAEAEPEPEMKYISSTKPRPAASSIPKAKENNTLKHGSRVKEVNGDHLYHDRSQGKMKRLEEADRAFLEAMRAKQAGGDAQPARSPSASPVGAFTSPLFAAPSPSPDPTASPITPMDESRDETEEERKARKAAKRAKKEAKRKAQQEEE